MIVSIIEPGDTIFAAKDILDDGSMPGFEEGSIIVPAGSRGVVINTGHLEVNPDKTLLLVRFEKHGESGDLGPAVACWPEELRIADDTKH